MMPTGGGHAKTCQELRSRSRAVVIVSIFESGRRRLRLGYAVASVLCSLATPLLFAICLVTLTAISLRRFFFFVVGGVAVAVATHAH